MKLIHKLIWDGYTVSFTKCLIAFDHGERNKFTDNWKKVTCKNCLKMKRRIK